MSKKKTGVFEWADESVNIQIGCEHDCRYCYARYRAVQRFGYCQSNKSWKKPIINLDKVNKGYKRTYGTVMFPSTHDITPINISEYLVVLRKLLDSGNQVLIVSKPHMDCIRVIVDAYEDYRDRIMFRFTIGTLLDEILKFWEPGAPLSDERLECLKYAFEKGYRTSVSCEPYLDPHVLYTYIACADYITDSFWIGKMRAIASRALLDGITDEQRKRYVDVFDLINSDGYVRYIYNIMKDFPPVRWKDSISEVIGDLGEKQR